MSTVVDRVAAERDNVGVEGGPKGVAHLAEGGAEALPWSPAA